MNLPRARGALVVVLLIVVCTSLMGCMPGSPLDRRLHGDEWICTETRTVYIDRWSGTEEECVAGYWVTPRPKTPTPPRTPPATP